MYTYAIGDIHGKLGMLVQLLRLIDKDAAGEDYKLVFIGDYIDRGEDSKGVIDFLMRLQKIRSERGLETICLMGNHEDMAVNEEYHNSWLLNGGHDTLLSYPEKVMFQEHIEWIKALPLYHETDNNYFAHACVVPNVPLEKQISASLLWNRYRYEEPSGLNKVLIHGHTPRKNVEITDDRINIDTGAVYIDMGYGKLTAAKIPDNSGIPIDYLWVQEDLLSRRITTMLGEYQEFPYQ